MSGRQVSQSNAYSHLSRSNSNSFPPRHPSWAQYPITNNCGLPHSPCGSESSTSSVHSEPPFNSGSPKYPLERICMGQSLNSRCAETSNLVSGPNMAQKPISHHNSPQCLLCTDHPSCPASPTFLDQLIKGINYLDRSTSIFSNSYPKALSLPQLAATCLERAASSFYMDQMDPTPLRSYSMPSTNITGSNFSPTNSSLVPSIRDTNTLHNLGSSTGLGCQHRPHNQNFSDDMAQRPALKLPDISLFGNGLFSLGRLPKVWEAIRSGWNAPEKGSKPESWW